MLLGQSTVLPGNGRILKQYTIDDVKKELQLLTHLQDDKAAFTKGIKVSRDDIL